MVTRSVFPTEIMLCIQEAGPGRAQHTFQHGPSAYSGREQNFTPFGAGGSPREGLIQSPAGGSPS